MDYVRPGPPPSFASGGNALYPLRARGLVVKTNSGNGEMRVRRRDAFIFTREFGDGTISKPPPPFRAGQAHEQTGFKKLRNF